MISRWEFGMMVLILFSVLTVANSQSVEDTIPIKSSWLFGTDFSTNSPVNGQVNELVSQPSFSGYVAYFSKYNFDFSVVGSTIWNSDSSFTKSTREFGLSVGYSLPLTKWLLSSVSYSHYFYPGATQTLQSGLANMSDVTLSSQVKWWQTDASAGYSWGEYNEFYLSLQTGAQIVLSKVLSKKDVLTFEPSFSLFFSDIDYYNTSLVKTYWYLYPYASENPTTTISDMLVDIKTAPFGKTERDLRVLLALKPTFQRDVTKLPSNQIVWDIFQSNKSFTLGSLGVTLPMNYMLGSWTLSSSVSVYLPQNQPSYANNNLVWYFSGGLSYLIDR